MLTVKILLRIGFFADIWQIFLSLVGGLHAFADGVPDDCTQLILGTAPTWEFDARRVALVRASAQRRVGGLWGGPFPVLFGKNVLAWGTGVAGQNEPGLRKKETRWPRAGAEFLRSAKCFDYEAHLPPGADYTYHQVH